MNGRFVVRGTALALLVALPIVAAALVLRGTDWFSAPIEIPPPPVIAAPRGAPPAGPVGLIEQAQYGGGPYHGVGHGFVLRLADGGLVGITTAHSLSFDAQPPLRRVALMAAGMAVPAWEADRLHGEPGTARSGEDMTVDYVLLAISPDAAIDPGLVVQPDPRGLPQPGERVTLYTSVGGQPRTFGGTIISAEAQAVWVAMDSDFDPSGMSGSPVISAHTGQVVGMVIATTRRGGIRLLGLHSIGSLVRLAEAAEDLPKIEAYRR